MKHFFPSRNLLTSKFRIFHVLSSLIFFTILIIGDLNAQSSDEIFISFEVKDASLKDALKQIEGKTKFLFSYKSKDIDNVKGITFQTPNASVSEVLRQLLKNTSFRFLQVRSNIVIVKNDESIEDTLIDPKSISQKTRLLFGRIYNSENNDPIAGASIVCIGGAKTVHLSDRDGQFSFNISEGCESVEISYVGFIKKRVSIDKKVSIDVALNPRSDFMSNVVVTGYTTVDRRLSASAVSTISGDDLERKDFVSVDQMLQGKVSGLNVNITSTTPGAAPKIRLRGTSTLLGNREPIWVVDGFVIDAPVKLSSQDINSLDNVNLLTSPIAGVNPNDIERIDVLKDASATALYGVNGANGVIVITTKSGKFNQKLSVNYSTNIVYTTPPSYARLPLMNSKQRIDVSREITDRGLNYSVAQPRIGYEGAYQDYVDGLITFEEYEKKVNYFETLNTNWMDILFRPSLTQSHNINFSAGSNNTTYFASLGFNDQNSSAIYNNQQRYTGLFKFNSKLNNKITIGLKMSGSINTSETPLVGDLYDYAYKTSRALEFENAGKRVAYITDVVTTGTTSENYAAGYNIMNELEGSRRTNNNRAMDLSGNVEWKLLKNLRFKGNYGFATTQAGGKTWATEETYYVADAYRNTIKAGIPIPEALKPQVIMPRGGEYRESQTIRNSYTVRNSLDYTLKNGNSFFSAALGNEIRSTEYNTTNSFRLGYLPERGLIFYTPNQTDYPLYYTRLSTGSFAPLTLSNKVDRFASWYGIFTYALKNRYTFNVNFRNDGSNRFGTEINKKFLPTFSSAARWIISDEKWFDNVPKLNLLALRVSYGYNGNVPESESPRLIITQPGINSVNMEDFSTVTTYPNPYLRWEQTNTVNGGLEFTLFNRRLSGEIDLYYKRGKDLISTIQIPAYNGINSVAINGAGIVNKGYELNINVVPIKSFKWNWNIGFLFGRNYSKILESAFADPSAVTVTPGKGFYSGIHSYLYGNVIREGLDPNTFYAYKFTGLSSTGMPTFNGIYNTDYTGKPGILEYYNNILTPVGSRIPKFDGSFNTSLQYKNVSLRANFIVKLGYYQRYPFLYNNGSNMIPNVNENFSSEFVDRWRNPGDEKFTNIPALSDRNMFLSASAIPYAISSTVWQLYNFSDVRIADASHLRLSSLSLNYKLQKNNAKSKSLFNNTNVSLQGNDLFVIAGKSWKGRDPETLPTSLGRLPSFTLSLSVAL
jgi:TonB-linked SusC/RagA family outer membrane protein